jgi:hypothetical protein
MDFMKQQIDASERLFKMMLQDHEERLHQSQIMGELTTGLMKKLDERDTEIMRLRKELQSVKEALK